MTEYSDKFLLPDGSIASFGTHEIVEEASEKGAVQYQRAPVVASKFLMPDGSIVSGIPLTMQITKLGQLRIEKSDSFTVEKGGVYTFSVYLSSLGGGSISAADIDVTSLFASISRSTGGGAFTTLGVTQSSFSKADGAVFVTYQFISSEWITGDSYKIVMGGVSVTLEGETLIIPTSAWGGILSAVSNIEIASSTTQGLVTEIHEFDLPAIAQALSRIHDEALPAIATDVRTAIGNTTPRAEGNIQHFSKIVTSVANAGDVPIAQAKEQDMFLRSIIIFANEAQTADLTSIAIFSGAGKVIELISATDGAVIKFNATGKQVVWEGCVYLPVNEFVIATLAGTGTGHVKLTILIECCSMLDNGYLE
jgi:hypothetical protein